MKGVDAASWNGPRDFGTYLAPGKRTGPLAPNLPPNPDEHPETVGFGAMPSTPPLRRST